jgi:hypothetical protein
MSGYLKQEMAVASFMQDLTRMRTLYWQSTQDKGPGSEPEILACLPPLHADAGDRVGAPEFLL